MRKISLFLILVVMILLSSCYGKWEVDVYYRFYGDRSAAVSYKFIPVDATAKEKFESIKNILKKENPEAEVMEKQYGESRWLEINEKIPPGENELLSSDGSYWIFKQKNRSTPDFNIKTMRVSMPGLIKDSNADRVFLNQAIWEGADMPRYFQAKSGKTPMYVYPLITIILLILIGAGIYFYGRKSDQENSMELDKAEITER